MPCDPCCCFSLKDSAIPIGMWTIVSFVKTFLSLNYVQLTCSLYLTNYMLSFYFFYSFKTNYDRNSNLVKLNTINFTIVYINFTIVYQCLVYICSLFLKNTVTGDKGQNKERHTVESTKYSVVGTNEVYSLASVVFFGWQTVVLNHCRHSVTISQVKIKCQWDSPRVSTSNSRFTSISKGQLLP